MTHFAGALRWQPSMVRTAPSLDSTTLGTPEVSSAQS